ncbi:hypothetical protein CBR_g34359 [Chara braunii]|uniref:Uncharacterized protein n=1 Tax=Chara braunii TaxID=69332 RepID=A0A388LID3_CHABU|nr:hypothetical protein CBR_g34359 [Chara braunii]|eukprot:GBG82079.1 hypothetical protein CBR_g34359 [Chara braunii]
MNIERIIENVAVKVGRVHVLVNALVIDVRSYSVLLGLPWAMAVGARLHFDSRQLVLTQTGGKPQTVPLRVSTRTIKRVPNSAQIGMLRCIDPEECSPSDISDGTREQEYEEELPSEDEWKHLVELFEHEILEEFQVCPDPARSFHVDSRDSAFAPPITQVSPSVLLGEPILQVSDLADDLEPPRTLYEGALSLRTRYQQTEQYLDVSVFPPISLLTAGVTIALLKQEAEASLSFCLARVHVTWTGTSEHPTWIENPELLIIQAWRTNVEGDLLGFLFGLVRPGRRHLIAQELIARIVQLADDLSPDIYFESDDSPAPYIFERSLDPYLQLTACLEEPRDEDTLPSRQEYLKPYEIIPHAFYPRVEEVVIDDDDEEDEDEETSEEGSYSEHSEGELSKGEEEEEETGSEWEALPDEATRTGTEADDPEAVRKREEIATRKHQLEFASQASLRIGNDPTRDPELPKPEDGDPAAATSSTARQRRSRSPSSSSPTRPPVRPRTDAGDRPSSSDAFPPTP